MGRHGHHHHHRHHHPSPRHCHHGSERSARKQLIFPTQLLHPFPIKFAKKLSLCDWYCFQWCTTWAELSSSSCHWTSGRVNICNLFLCGSPIFWCLYDPAIRCPLVQETSAFLEEWHEAHLQPGHKLDKLSVSKRMRVGIGHRPGMIDKTLKRAEAFDTFGTCTCGAS